MSISAGQMSTKEEYSLQISICKFLDFLEVYALLSIVVSLTELTFEIPCKFNTLLLITVSSAKFSVIIIYYTSNGLSQVQVFLFPN